jgi:hypothetical protein
MTGTKVSSGPSSFDIGSIPISNPFGVSDVSRGFGVEKVKDTVAESKESGESLSVEVDDSVGPERKGEALFSLDEVKALVREEVARVVREAHVAPEEEEWWDQKEHRKQQIVEVIPGRHSRSVSTDKQRIRSKSKDVNSEELGTLFNWVLFGGRSCQVSRDGARSRQRSVRSTGASIRGR